MLFTKEGDVVSDNSANDSLLEMFLYESLQLIEQLENILLTSEKEKNYSETSINEIFRVMHTIKGSSAMMTFSSISAVSHSIEDLFFFIREEKPQNIDFTVLSDLIFEGIDFIKSEIERIKNSEDINGDISYLSQKVKSFLNVLKGVDSQAGCLKALEAIIFFEEGCEMENIRAFSVINSIKDLVQQLVFFPEDIYENDASVEIIRKSGFKMVFKTLKNIAEINQILQQTVFLKDLELHELSDDIQSIKNNAIGSQQSVQSSDNSTVASDKSKNPSSHQSIISVNVSKLDKLMDLVGELVISQSMVIQNPDLDGLELENFRKSALQLMKITGELRDIAMSIRMVPLATTFQKMNRVIRDMSKKLNKEVILEIIGEETEVDKNIIDHISDPIMHLVRNALDHGIETSEERTQNNKNDPPKVTLEAKNAGGDVLIIVRDNGKGLNKEKILQRAVKNDLLKKPVSEMSDKDIYSLIFLPGFSTKEQVSEFSGRGVGMDVVTRNIQEIGGVVSVESIEGSGTSVILKIPLTLAIIEGMTVKVGNSRFTIPINSIKESFKVREKDVINGVDGSEMLIVRGRCYPIVRLRDYFQVSAGVAGIEDGIILMLENDGNIVCAFADELLGEQQAVVKALPKYIKKVRGLAGCTLLGDGDISLIIDTAGLTAL